MTDWHQRFAKYYEDVLRASAQSSGRSLTRVDKLFDRGLACDLEILGLGLSDILEKEVVSLNLEAPGAQTLEVESDSMEDEEGAGEEAAPIELPEPAPEDGDPHRGDRILAVKAGRKIQRSQARDPYNRETTLGGPIVSVRQGDREQSGPLLYWEVELTYNPAQKRLTVAKRSPVPELNVMLLESFLDEAGDVELLTRELQEVVLSDAVSVGTVDRLIRVIPGVVDGWDEVQVVQNPEGPLRKWLRQVTGPPAVSHRAVLLNAPRSHAVLLEDLRKIAQLPAAPPGGPLDIITSPEDAVRNPSPRESPLSFSDTADGGDPLWYPFESNPSQRRVGHMAERARILTVQGPPGTGKSRTISNLVCHLVASGRSVLVTSHQRKAVEVVADLLQPIPELALPLIQGDRESSQKLQARIQEFLEDHTLNVDEATQDAKRGMEALHELDQGLRILAHRFQELTRKENEQWEGFQSYDDLRQWDEIDPGDHPTSDQASGIVRGLPEWCTLCLEMGTRKKELMTLVCPDGERTTGATEARVVQDLQSLIELAEHLRATPTDDLIRAVRRFLEAPGVGTQAGAPLAAALLTWIRHDGWSLVGAAERATVSFDSAEILNAWVQAGRTAPQGTLHRIEGKVAELAAFFEEVGSTTTAFPPPINDEDAEILSDALLTLETSGGGLLRWHMWPSVRKARETIEQRLGRAIERSRWQRVVSRGRDALSWYERERLVGLLAEEVRALAPDLPPFELPAPGIQQRVSWLSLTRRVHAGASVLRLIDTVPASLWPRLVHAAGLAGGAALDRRILQEVERVVNAVAEEFRREAWLREFEEETPLSPEWMERFGPLLDGLRGGLIPDEGLKALDWLLAHWEHVHRLRRVRDLERGQLNSLPKTRERLSEELAESPVVPAWVTEHLDEALKAHRLGGLIRQSLTSDPDSIVSVADALRRGEHRRRGILFELVRRRHRMYQATALETGNLNAELQNVRQLLRQPGRLKQSLVALRGRIDYRTVLKALPAWICTIDDAARLFPPESELFDYVIIDEASQCAQPALLPLALRCRHLIVVGDEKQLRPSFARFLPTAQLEALRTTHGLDTHRAGLFTRGDASLLELASFRANQGGFLNEHFRCDPAIIRWSNKRFYGDRLRILTHRRPLSFRPALNVVRLEDADDDTEKKQNVQEANAVVRELRQRTDDPANAKLSMGVISPFRQQADLIQGLIEKEFESDPETLERHRIVSSTADGFQGDERDIILYSFRVGPSSNPNSVGVLERQEERFNVAFSRARRLGVSFLSCSPSRLPKDGPTRSWIEHSLSVANGDFGPDGTGRADHFDSDFEKKVCGRLRDRGLHVVTQEPCGPFRIDLVVTGSEGRMLAIECDGEWKADAFGRLRPEDYQRQDLIERAGWVVHRISGRKYLLDPVREIDAVIEALERQPSAEDLGVLSGEISLDEGTDGPEDLPPTPDVPSDQGPPHTREVDVEAEERDPEPEPEVEEVLDQGDRAVLARLVRWSLQGSQVKGSMFDRLINIDERLKDGKRLTDEDHRALKFIRRLAESQGFDPNEDVGL